MDIHNIPFVPAMFFTEVGDPPRHPRVIVVHTMEAPEKGITAESVAAYFKAGCPDNGQLRKTSAHYCIDSDSIVQCVQCKDVAYGAPNMNRLGIHLEHAGYSAQSSADWADAYSLAMLKLSSELCREVLCPKFSIDKRWLSPDEIRSIGRGQSTGSGFCTHRDVTKAFGTPGGHLDPGLNFPKDLYMQWVRLNS
jgi:hypothetical protein